MTHVTWRSTDPKDPNWLIWDGQVLEITVNKTNYFRTIRIPRGLLSRIEVALDKKGRGHVHFGVGERSQSLSPKPQDAPALVQACEAIRGELGLPPG